MVILKQDPRRLYTWKSSAVCANHRVKNQIDFILIKSFLPRFNIEQNDVKRLDNPILQNQISEKLETRLCKSANRLTGVESQWKVIKSALTDIQENEMGFSR